MTYEKTTREKLLAEADKRGLTAEVENIMAARDASAEAPIKADVIQALKESDSKMELEGVKVDANGVKYVEVKDKLQMAIDYAEALVAVKITDHDTSMSIEGATEGILHTQTWGSMAITPRRERVRVDGVPTTCSRGCVIAMKEVMIPSFYTGRDGKPKVGTKARFAIEELPGMSEEEFEALKAKQNMQKAGKKI